MDLLLNALQFIEHKYGNININNNKKVNKNVSIENRYPYLTKLDIQK